MPVRTARAKCRPSSGWAAPIRPIASRAGARAALRARSTSLPTRRARPPSPTAPLGSAQQELALRREHGLTALVVVPPRLRRRRRPVRPGAAGIRRGAAIRAPSPRDEAAARPVASGLTSSLTCTPTPGLASSAARSPMAFAVAAPASASSEGETSTGPPRGWLRRGGGRHGVLSSPHLGRLVDCLGHCEEARARGCGRCGRSSSRASSSSPRRATKRARKPPSVP